jgi:hypothetical protein
MKYQPTGKGNPGLPLKILPTVILRPVRAAGPKSLRSWWWYLSVGWCLFRKVAVGFPDVIVTTACSVLHKFVRLTLWNIHSSYWKANTHVIKKLSAFYEIWSLIIVFTRAR